MVLAMDPKVTMLLLIIGTIISVSNSGGAKLTSRLVRVRARVVARLRGDR